MSQAIVTPEIFEECLLQLQEGISLEKVLGSHPEQAAELRPLLETARRLPFAPLDGSQAGALRQNGEPFGDAVVPPESWPAEH